MKLLAIAPQRKKNKNIHTITIGKKNKRGNVADSHFRVVIYMQRWLELWKMDLVQKVSHGVLQGSSEEPVTLTNHDLSLIHI